MTVLSIGYCGFRGDLAATVPGLACAQRNEYSTCPIVTEYGRILMCEFGYDGRLMPTIPWLDPAVDRGMWWTLKVHGLRPLCFQGMLKGLL